MPTTTQRGYGAEHQAERQRWQARIDAGEEILCVRCGELPLIAGHAWDLGHTDDRSAWTGPEHISCNRAAGGRAAHRNAAFTSREW